MSYFFEPELMAAAVLVKTIVFDQFLIFLFFDFFLIFWGWVSQVSGVRSTRTKNTMGATRGATTQFLQNFDLILFLAT